MPTCPHWLRIPISKYQFYLGDNFACSAGTSQNAPWLPAAQDVVLCARPSGKHPKQDINHLVTACFPPREAGIRSRPARKSTWFVWKSRVARTVTHFYAPDTSSQAGLLLVLLFTNQIKDLAPGKLLCQFHWSQQSWLDPSMHRFLRPFLERPPGSVQRLSSCNSTVAQCCT